MTREEAISEWAFRSNHIKKWLDEYGEEPSIRHYVELIDMAIEALKADVARWSSWNKTFEQSGIADLISRADAIEAVQSLYYTDRKKVLEAIKALPSADRPTKCIAEIKIDNDDLIKRIKEEYELADRPQGEWIYKTNDESVCEEWECSKCGNWNFAKTDYCPNCGARMEATK